MVYLTAGGEAVLRTLPADAAIRNLPVAPRPPLPTAPLSRVPIPPGGSGAAAAGGGAAGGAATASSAAATAGAIAAGVLAFGFGFAVGDAVAGSLGIEYPGGKNALQYFFGGKNPGIGATGAVDTPILTSYEGEPPFTGGQSPGVNYRIRYNVGGTPREGVIPSTDVYGPVSGLTRQEIPGPGPFGEPYGVTYPGTARNSSGGSVQIALNLGGAAMRWIANSAEESLFTVTGLTVTPWDGSPDTGGNPAGTPQPGTMPNRVGAPLIAAPTAPAPSPTPTIAPTPPPAPATPGDPVNPPEDKQNPALPGWLYQLPYVMPAASPGAGITPSIKPGTTVISVNNPQPDAGTGGTTPPTKTRTDNACRCNIPLFNKLDALDKKIDGALGGANLAAEGGIFAYLQRMQAFAEKAWEMSRIQKVLNALTLITVLHNASMVSRDVGETLGYALAQGLDVLGIEDEEGNALDVNGWFGTQANNFFENLFGAERWHGLNETWNKANRIISSATMIVWTLRSIHDGTQEVLEWTAENTGKIGNALRKWGVVGERAYGPMAERVKAQDAYRRKISRFLDGAEAIENTASSFAAVTSEVINIQDEVGQLGEQRENFNNAVRDLVPGAYPDNSDIPTTEEAAKANATAGPAVTATDMEPGTNGTP